MTTTLTQHTFARPVDKRSKRSMAEFLAEHFRYDTMNRWNQATSYANNVKIHNVVPYELQDKAYDLLSTEDSYDSINQLMRDWDADHGHYWQVGFNGRSNGYIVLYQGGSKQSDYKRVCWSCGQKNYTATAAKCGICGSENMHDWSGIETFTYPGRGVDDDMSLEDLLEWGMDDLRDRVALVQSFDQLCDDVVAEFIGLCSHEIVEETIYLPKTIKRLAREDEEA